MTAKRRAAHALGCVGKSGTALSVWRLGPLIGPNPAGLDGGWATSRTPVPARVFQLKGSEAKGGCLFTNSTDQSSWSPFHTIEPLHDGVQRMPQPQDVMTRTWLLPSCPLGLLCFEERSSHGIVGAFAAFFSGVSCLKTR